MRFNVSLHFAVLIVVVKRFQIRQKNVQSMTVKTAYLPHIISSE
jgi:hypothetical protein